MEEKIRSGFTAEIFINEDKIEGYFLKENKKIATLPNGELEVIKHLPEIMDLLIQGKVLKISILEKNEFFLTQLTEKTEKMSL